MKKALKIKLSKHSEFQLAWDALLKLGYHYQNEPPHTAPYLYAHADGLVRVDFFDIGGADLSSPKSALGHFENHQNNEITLAELMALAYGSEDTVFQGINPEYIYYSVDADGDAWYTKIEPHISKSGDFWGKDISMKTAPNFNLHTDWKQSLIKRNSSKEMLTAR